ncbi:MAG: LysM peptidoglycan-binding domain-containing M23 family metallopeptidase [Candidatus Uhrbacteria bacterium]
MVRAVGIPAYRLGFYVHRQVSKLIAPAKHRMLYLVSNKYAVHAAVVAIAAIASSANLSQTSVRAETFGSHSMLYSLVAGNETSAVEVVSAASANAIDVKPSSYMDDPAIDANAHIDVMDENWDYATTSVGSAVASPTISSGSASVAAREKTENYVVVEGDTLGGISDKFGLSLSTVLWANGLTFRSTLHLGQSLVIPPVDGVMYTVKKGDTLNKIANTYGSDTDKMIAFNKLASADDLHVGDELVIPGGEPPAPVVKKNTAPLASLFSSPRATPPKDGADPSAGGGSKWTPFVAPKGDGETEGTWVWPTDWHVITQKFGWKHTGVDLDGDYNTHSYAAADGVVIYSGWRTGYGNTVEISHGNGVVTRYGHHSKLYVKEGDVVKAGQLIAQTGSTGHSTGTHLHFEVIVNGKFQNPLNYVR